MRPQEMGSSRRDSDLAKMLINDELFDTEPPITTSSKKRAPRPSENHSSSQRSPSRGRRSVSVISIRSSRSPTPNAVPLKRKRDEEVNRNAAAAAAAAAAAVVAATPNAMTVNGQGPNDSMASSRSKPVQGRVKNAKRSIATFFGVANGGSSPTHSDAIHVDDDEPRLKFESSSTTSRRVDSAKEVRRSSDASGASSKSARDSQSPRVNNQPQGTKTPGHNHKNHNVSNNHVHNHQHPQPASSASTNGTTEPEVAGYKHSKSVDRSAALAHLRKTPLLFPPKSLPTDNKSIDTVAEYRKKLEALDGPPVTLVCDSADGIDLDLNFEFINHFKMGEGVHPSDPEFNFGCSCEDGCDPETCDCAAEGAAHSLPGADSDDEDGETEFIPPYIRNDAGLIVLNPDFLARDANTVFECSPLCGCGPDCWNKLTQKGVQTRFELFKTKHCGLGLRSPDFIHQGQFLGYYKGELITDEESDRRHDALGKAHNYLFGLDNFSTEDIYVIDGRRYGNITRFFNHSCSPNLIIKPVAQSLVEKRIYDIGFFALKDIPPGQELCFDYNPLGDAGDHEHTADAVKCRCGAKNCRGILWRSI